MVAIALALAGVVAGGWAWLLIAPLLITWAICVNGALKAPIDKRFRGIKARALVALLIYVGPIVRGYERIKWRFKEMRAPEAASGLAEAEPAIQKARLALRERAFYLSYWSETGDEKEALLGGLMRFLAPQKYFVVADQGWDEWDLKIARGLWSRALVLVCTENHGGGKRLLRVRCALRLSRFAGFVLRAYALGVAAALILNAPAAATVVCAIGLAHGGVIAHRTLAFGRLMHRIIETVARRQALIPVPLAEQSSVGTPSPRPA